MSMFNLKSLGSLTVKSLISANAPSIIKGVMIELLHTEALYKGRRRKINVKFLVELVETNQSLWELFPPGLLDRFRNALAQVGDIDWFTAAWIIEAIRIEHAALASLFLGWRKAYHWLERQAKEIKENLNERR